MADSAGDNPQRSAADKERSRQLSRPVSGKEVAKGGRGGRPQGAQGRAGQGARQARPGQQARRPQSGRGPAPRQAGRAGAKRPGARRPPARRPVRPARSRRGLYTWGAVALVVVIVGIVVGISQTSSPTTKGVYFKPTPVSAKVLDEISHVPTSTFNAVGTGITGDNYVPTAVTGQKPLKFGGKAGLFGLFGEFCPYCAAERWAIITSLSRFGTFTGLRTMQSSPIDVYPRTQTFEFNTTTYTSPYVAAKLLEFYGQDKATGKHTVINAPTKAEIALIKKYDVGGTTRSGTIPFMDVGNRVIFSGASFNPNPLQGLSRDTIAAALKNPDNPVTKLILGTSNYMSAAVCSIDGGKPGSVCTSAGVKAAAKALKLTS
jgi:Domain of unknown function (DUF929)